MNRNRNLLAFFVAIIALFSISSELFSQTQGKTRKGVKKSPACSSCHKDIQAVLPKNHKSVSGDSISACIKCHRPDPSGKIEPRIYASILHRSHIKAGVTDCFICHTYKANQFGLSGYKKTYGKISKDDFEKIKEIFLSWSTSKNTDSIHGKVDLLCSACHGKNLPVIGDAVDNDTCLTCHGPLEALKKRSEPKDFPDRNPHNSHLGDISCVVCHKGHAPSSVYCLGCHGNFKMKIPGGM